MKPGGPLLYNDDIFRPRRKRLLLVDQHVQHLRVAVLQAHHRRFFRLRLLVPHFHGPRHVVDRGNFPLVARPSRHGSVKSRLVYLPR